jgi:hypothetical protein
MLIKSIVLDYLEDVKTELTHRDPIYDTVEPRVNKALEIIEVLKIYVREG